MEQVIIAEFNIPIPMRDGTILYANIYRPKEGKWPVLLTRLPYGKDNMNLPVFNPLQAARCGYIVIIQDVRGTGTSEGDWYPYIHEAVDGVDTFAWVTQLPYNAGQVGMFGESYFGVTQWLAALQQPPTLKAFAPLIAWSDPLNSTNYRSGAFELGRMASWNASMALGAWTKSNPGIDPDEQKDRIASLIREIDQLNIKGYWSLPLNDFAPLKREANVAPTFFDALNHPMDQSFFDSITIKDKHDKISVPAFIVGGWYDAFQQDALNNFISMKAHGATPEARCSKLVMGPWSHSMWTSNIGDLNFGIAANAATIGLNGMLIHWFDYWLKGIENAVLEEAPVKLFVMGANIWRDEYEWPLARAINTRYYLHSAGKANTLRGDGWLSTEIPLEEAADQYVYDPRLPVMTRGGNLLMSLEYPGGPFDQREIEQRKDVLVYTTPVLKEDIEVTGPIVLYLWAISSAPDTDYIIRLVDVHPNGYAQNLTDGIIRARYKDFPKNAVPQLIEPGKSYEYRIDLWSTSNVFKAGHRIRIDITSSNFPRWDRNHNTGHAFASSDTLEIAYQTVLHDQNHPSHVLLPIVPHS